VQIYAHRGANLKLPENTLEAFRQGLIDGATALELDVRVTSDNVVIVFHDATGLRMAKEDKLVSKTPWSDIKNWDLGKSFQSDGLNNHFFNQAYHVPTLAEILEAFPNVFINVDIKVSNLRAVSLVVDLIRQHKAAPRVRLSSFSHHVHKILRNLRYEGLVSLSRLEIMSVYLLPEVFLKNMKLKGRAIQIPISWAIFPFDGARFIEKCHKLGLTVEYWTINSRHDAKKLIARGVDGIITDDPAMILAAMNE